MISLKELNLSDSDFKLIVLALDTLPKFEESGKTFYYMMAVMIAGTDKPTLHRLKAEHEADKLRDKNKKEMMIEDIKILQGKLLMFKRHLAEEGALSEANSIINS